MFHKGIEEAVVNKNTELQQQDTPAKMSRVNMQMVIILRSVMEGLGEERV